MVTSPTLRTLHRRYGRSSREQKEGQFAPDLDTDSLSYAIWCLNWGFNANAMARNLSKEDVPRRFDYASVYSSRESGREDSLFSRALSTLCANG